MKRTDYVTRTLRAEVPGPMVALLLALVLLAKGPAAQAQITVAVGNGSGAPGSTASVTNTLTGSSGNVAQVGYDVLFDVNILDIQTTDCTLAPRLAATHTLAAFLPAAGRLRLGILDLTPPLATFDDGDLATCTFHVNSGAALGTTPLTMQNLEVSDNSVPPVVLASTAVNGAIEVALVSPTPTLTITPTSTPQPPTSTPTTVLTSTPTRTNTVPVPTNTATPPVSNTPTATRTRTAVGPTATLTGAPAPGGGGGGCTIAAPNDSGVSPLAWLVTPAALLLWRRRPRR